LEVRALLRLGPLAAMVMARQHVDVLELALFHELEPGPRPRRLPRHLGVVLLAGPRRGRADPALLAAVRHDVHAPPAVALGIDGSVARRGLLELRARHDAREGDLDRALELQRELTPGGERLGADLGVAGGQAGALDP